MTKQIDGVIIENEYDIAEQLLRARMRMKTLSQLSYELRAIDTAFPSNQYEIQNAEQILGLYDIIESKIVELAIEIQNKKTTL